jgi:hypothetical protein
MPWLDRYRRGATVEAGEDPRANARLTTRPLPAITQLDQRAALAFSITAADSIEAVTALTVMAGRPLVRAPSLPRQQPRPGRIAFLGIGISHRQQRPQRGTLPPSRGRELGTRPEQALDQQGPHPVTLPRPLGSAPVSHPAPFEGLQHRCDVALGPGRSLITVSVGASRGWSLRTRRNASTFAAGQAGTLASVRVRIVCPSRPPSRRRTAGRE